VKAAPEPQFFWPALATDFALSIVQAQVMNLLRSAYWVERRGIDSRRWVEAIRHRMDHSRRVPEELREAALAVEGMDFTSLKLAAFLRRLARRMQNIAP